MRSVNAIFLTGVMTPWFERSIGAYQLSNFLKHYEYTTQVIDFTHLIEPSTLLELLCQFTGSNTKIIGISSTFILDSATNLNINPKPIPDWLLSTLRKYKEMFPDVKIVVGGSKATLYADIDIVDTIITGYAEIALLNYLKSDMTDKTINGDQYLKYFDTTQINHKFCKNDIILQNETLPIEVSRGCIFKCKFCSYPLNGKKKLDHIRDINLLKEELIHNYNNWGITNYLISDDTFNDNNEKLKNLHKMITSLPFKINFVCYLRLDLLYTFKDQQLELLEEMGLRSCHFGVETFNIKTAKFIGKGLNTDKLKLFLLELSERWKNKISFVCSFIVGLPFETKESCIKTGNWCKENNIPFWLIPLTIHKDAEYKSDIDINYEKYGYRLVNDEYWETDLMTYQDAVNISGMFTAEYSSQKISAWNLFALLNVQVHSISELSNMRYQDIDRQIYQHSRYNRLNTYIEGLRNV